MGNCDELLFLGGPDATTLEYISKKLGKETIRTRNASRNFGSKGGGGSESYNVTGRELMMPDEIACMDNNNCILFIRGLHPFFGEKYDYPKHPNYHMTGDADKELLFMVNEKFHTAASNKEADEAEELKERLKAQSRKSDQFNAGRAEKAHRKNKLAMRDHSLKGLRLNQPADIIAELSLLAEQNPGKTMDQVAKIEEIHVPISDALDEYGGLSEEATLAGPPADGTEREETRGN